MIDEIEVSHTGRIAGTECPGTPGPEMEKRPIPDWVWIIVFLAIGVVCAFIFVGCVSAYATTGAQTEAQAKVQSSQGMGQANASNDTTSLEVPPSVVTLPSGEVITAGGGRLSTGSTQTQISKAQTDVIAEAASKGAAEGTSKSSFNMTALIIGAIVIALVLLGFEVLRWTGKISF